MQSRRIPLTLVLPVIIIAVVAGLFYQVHEFSYVWDDNALFVDSVALREPTDIWRAVAQPILPGTTYFRPAVLLSFVAEFFLFGPVASVSHLVNLALFLVNVALVGSLAWRLAEGDDRNARVIRCAIAMAFYGLHPTMIEPTVWVAGRFDLMVTTFILLALLAASYLKGFKRLSVVCAAFLLAAFSKEMAATFPALLVLWSWALYGAGSTPRAFVKDFLRRKEWPLLLAVACCGVLYLAIRGVSQYALYHQDREVAAALDPVSHLAFVGQTLLFYARMVIWPFADINPMHPFELASMASHQTIAGGAAVLLVALLCLFSIRRPNKAVLMLLAGLVALLPVLNIIPLTIGGNIGHDRFLALPLAFFSLGLSCIRMGNRWISPELKRRMPVLLVALAVLWSMLAIANNRVTVPLWQTDVALWTWAYERHPDFPYVQFSLMSAAIRSRDLDTAAKIIANIEAGEGARSAAFQAIKGQYLQRRGKYEDAVLEFESAAAKSMLPHQSLVERGIPLASAKIENGSFTEAWFLRFLYSGLAESHLSLKNYSEALKNLEISEFYQRGYPPNYLIKSFALMGLGELEQAEAAYQAAIGSLVDEEARRYAWGMKLSFVDNLCKQEHAPQAVCREKQRIMQYRKDG